MEDQNNLICSPTESEGGGLNSFLDNDEVDYIQPSSRRGPINQVVQTLRGQTSGRNYSGLGSCPNLAGRTHNRPLLTRPSLLQDSLCPRTEEIVTPQGTIEVCMGGVERGNTNSPALITFHDLGLNPLSNFSTFFGCAAMTAIVSKFSILHITAPGQKPNAPDLPANFQYPSMDALSEMVEYVCHHYGIPNFVGLGVGLGANVLVRLALRRPKLVDGLILMNCTVSSAGWLEWAYNKINVKSLKKTSQLPENVVEYLLWYHLGQIGGGNRGIDSVSVASIYKQHFLTQVNPQNLCQLLQAYVTRSDIKLARDMAPNGKILYGACRTLKMPVINIVGDHSPHIEATVNFNGKLDPARCTWMKMQDAGMVLEEQANKVAEAIRLFLQGLGYTLRLGRSKSVCASPLKLQNPDGDSALKKLQTLNLNEDLNF